MPANAHQVSRVIQHGGTTVPTFLYGTAWKEDQTEALTYAAVQSGFLGIDTANQRRHYVEAGVGKAVQRILTENKLQRADLFLQTKFTYAAGQDHRLPYDPKANYGTQVRQSFASSLEHLNTSYLDSYILHGPASNQGLKEADWEVWRAMENLQKEASVKLTGISNITLEQLRLLIEKAEVKPAFVQNRCYARTKWEAGIRTLCQANGIIYQGFSLLTANLTELNRPELHKIARRHGCSVMQVVFRFALQVGMIPLTGTSSKSHMQEDLAAYEIELTEAEINTIENIAF
ncbi:Aldo/keto reductase [Candidatus Methylobacter favarea]|uniref:Aldo/keto reductase n=1 Tax=Candidatus Methylobacter favarea TaxID=2707345 RepID=A0A8S0X804_9GAMM|nr:aldo/keto reductase [Candidatus Methylobacter favarea]CAA9890570.1 Aldo/keto reductase [Candidatus Methylobacter favarea]